MQTVPSPITVRHSHNIRRLIETAPSAREIQLAARARRNTVRGRGYRGPLTRAELAAQTSR